MKFPLFIALGLIAGGVSRSQSTQPAQAASMPAPSAALLQPPAETLSVGSHFDELRVGNRVYHDVKVREVTPHSIVISNTEGIASIPLRELTPDLQKAFGYQPATDSEAAASDQNQLLSKPLEEQVLPTPRIAPRQIPRANLSGKFEHLAWLFDHHFPPQIRPEVDLRPKFTEFGLGIKSQGRRPSCVIFAVVSAAEFENAEVIADPERLSEDYLIWATCQTLKRAPQLISPMQLAENPEEEDHDMGFSFGSVLESFRVFGIATQTQMPDTFVRIGSISAPEAETIHDAATRRKLVVHGIPGFNNAARLANIIQLLNFGIPVPVALQWPSSRAARTGYLDTQRALLLSGHAVTLVGYKCPTGELADTEFIFRNSYGPKWGQAGYGRASFRYLMNNLRFAVALEIQRPDQPAPEGPRVGFSY